MGALISKLFEFRYRVVPRHGRYVPQYWWFGWPFWQPVVWYKGPALMKYSRSVPWSAAKELDAWAVIDADRMRGIQGVSAIRTAMDITRAERWMT